MKLERTFRRVGALVGVGLAGLVLTACHIPTFAAYKGNTVQGNATFHLWQGFFLAAIVVFLTVAIPLTYAIIRYRKRRNQEGLPPQIHSNTKWEIAYTVGPIITVAILFFFTVRVENKVDTVSRTPDLRVDITAYRWGWKFYYPAYNVTEQTNGVMGWPTFVLPEDETTTIRLVSRDVVHGFYMPEFDFSRYALPGVTNYFDFTPQHTASFMGKCSQFCGLYHAEMQFYAKVVTPTQFKSWIKAQPKGVNANTNEGSAGG